MKNVMFKISLFFVAILMFMLATPAISHAASASMNDITGSIGGYKDAEVVCGNYKYVSSGSFIFVMENKAGSLMQKGKSLNLRSTIRDLIIEGKTIYAAAGIAGMQIIDLNDPVNPKVIGIFNSSGSAEAIVVKGTTAYLANGNEGLEILNVSNPANPILLRQLWKGKYVFSVALNENNIFAKALDSSGLGTYSNLELSLDKSDTAKDNKQKLAYLTFDDGPSKINTPKNLDTLKKYGVKATFFVLPKNNCDDIYKRILDEGHVIGNHSFSHDYGKLYSSIDLFKSDVLKARDFIYEKLNYITTVFRFPGGSMGRSKSMISERVQILDNLGYKYFDWNVSTADTDPNLKNYKNEEDAVKVLTNNAIKNTRGKKRLIVLMHDSVGKGYTSKALPGIIEGLKKQGYTFDVLTNY
jgi:peptidoglycan/xylan/chitin deacetylase (PgdA/CDA1 family)